jgi:hypothetical protein
MICTLIAFLPLIFSACNDGDGGLTVRGWVTVQLEDAETGMEFREDTLLTEAEDEGAVSGYCTIDPNGPGEGLVTISIGRTGSVEPGSRRIRSFSVMRLSESDGQAEGSLSVGLGETTYEAEASATCSLDLIYVNTDTGQAGLETNCTVEVEGSSAQVLAELHFRDCEILEAS